MVLTGPGFPSSDCGAGARTPPSGRSAFPSIVAVGARASCPHAVIHDPLPPSPPSRSAGVPPASAMGTPPAVGARASCPHAVIHDPLPPPPPSRSPGVSPASDAVNGGAECQTAASPRSDIRPGHVCHHLASLIDLPPTILAAAGLPIPDTMAGRPLQQALADAPDWPTDIFAQISESQVGRCLRTKKWKYSVRAPQSHPWNVPDSDVYIDDFLYDLENDPHERENLVASPAHKEVRSQLAARLQQRLHEAGERPAEIRPA
ncbi:MAG: sulfatase/phosphatase domain-containing protein [Armatimonadia bacterium]